MGYMSDSKRCSNRLEVYQILTFGQLFMRIVINPTALRLTISVMYMYNKWVQSTTPPPPSKGGDIGFFPKRVSIYFNFLDTTHRIGLISKQYISNIHLCEVSSMAEWY